MNESSHSFKVGSILWALLIGVGCIFLAGTILLPSTKRAHFDFSRQREGDEDATASATTQPTTPASVPVQP
jgi:hypothetical protein